MYSRDNILDTCTLLSIMTSFKKFSFPLLLAKRAWVLDNILLKTFLPVYDTVSKNSRNIKF